jgi:hypothetical protein
MERCFNALRFCVVFFEPVPSSRRRKGHAVRKDLPQYADGDIPMSTKLTSIKIKFAAVALAALTLTGGLAATSRPAEARGFGLGLGIAAGVVGAAAVGAAVANGPYYNGNVYRRCGWVRQYDAYGNYVGRVRTCNY